MTTPLCKQDGVPSGPGGFVDLREFPPGMIGIPAADWVWTQAIISAYDLYDCGSPPGSILTVNRSGTTIAEKRNQIIDDFLTDSRLQWVLFLDSDMQPEHNTLSRLLQRDEPIVSALYFRRLIPYAPEFGRVDDDGKVLCATSSYATDETPLREVGWVGAGCLVVQRNVFTVLKRPWFQGIKGDVNQDVYFCQKARAGGFRILVDTNTVVGHVGVQSVDRQFAEAWLAGYPSGRLQ